MRLFEISIWFYTHKLFVQMKLTMKQTIQHKITAITIKHDTEVDKFKISKTQFSKCKKSDVLTNKSPRFGQPPTNNVLCNKNRVKKVHNPNLELAQARSGKQT